MALPNIADPNQPAANDNMRSGLYDSFTANSGIVGMAITQGDRGGVDKDGLKKVSENLSLLHDTVYQTLATLRSKTLLEDYIADDQLRVQVENLREGDGRLVQQLDSPAGSLMGGGDEQMMIVAALGSMSKALGDLIDVLENIHQDGESLGSTGMPNIDVDRRRPTTPKAPPKPKRNAQFVKAAEALDKKGRIKPGYEAVDVKKFGTRYRLAAVPKVKPTITGRLLAAGGRILSKPGVRMGGNALALGLTALPYITGERDLTVKNVARDAIVFGAGYLGMMAGGALGSLAGPVGTFVGGLAGGMAVATLADKGLSALGWDYNTPSQPTTPNYPRPPLIMGLGGFAVPTVGTISSGYGQRTAPEISPGVRGSSNHQGLDISAGTGTAVVASKDGVVTFTGNAGTYGNLIKIDHGGGIETRYGHLSQIATSVGKQVKTGDVIGLVGSTGRSTGPHLHFEIRSNGTSLDPTQYLGNALGREPPPRKISALTPPPRKNVDIVVPAPAAAQAGQQLAMAPPGGIGTPPAFNPSADFVTHWRAA